MSVDMLIAVLFVAFVAGVYFLAGAIAVRFFRDRKASSISARDWVVLGVAGVGALCMVYARFIEPNWLQTTRVEIRSVKVPPGKRPIRIAHFSDLHTEPHPRLERKLVEAVALMRPDVIVFTGDSVNDVSAIPAFRACFTALAKIAPTFAVRGNWDSDFRRSRELFPNTGAQELNGTAVRLEVDGVPIWIGGLAYNNASALNTIVNSVPRHEFLLLLYHTPDLIEQAVARRLDLYCAGHTHGGQVALPFYGAMITLSRFGKRYESGLYYESGTWLYVNRGIGMAGGLPRVRFWARPELTIIDVQPVS